MTGARAHTPSWWDASVPPTRVALASDTYIGTSFKTTVDGKVLGFRIYLGNGDNNEHVAFLWNADTNVELAIFGFKPFVVGALPAWRNAWCHPMVSVTAGVNYRLAILSFGNYYRTTNGLVAPVTNNQIQFIQGWQTTGINPRRASFGTNQNANGVDILFCAAGTRC